jgi:hypothetical protein
MKKILIFIVGAVLLTSCGNDWLDVAEPHTGDVTPNVLFVNEQSINNAVVGSIDLLREYYYDRHVTVGLRYYYLGFDFMGNDVISNPGQWWTYESMWHTLITSTTGYQTSYHWAMFYKVINDVNTKIVGIQEAPVSDAIKTQYIAELRAIRGLAYFSLAREYQFSYANVAPSAPCVPIYTEPTSAETKGNDRATVQQVYDQILDDLDYAVTNLTAARAAKFRINKNIAQAFRANVHLEMQNWALAEADANAARQGFPLMDKATYQSSGFNTIGTGEWMWGFPFQPDQAWGYASLFSHIDIFRPQNGYKNFFVNDNFVALFSDTDMRNVFVTPSPAYTAARPWARNGARKFQDRQPDADGDWVMMRASEMILVEAEAKAQQPAKVADAATLLFSLQSHRDPQAVASGNTGQALIDEILVERRKELYGEIGTEWFDLKRYNKPMVRNGNHALSHTFTIPAGDNRWNFQIPQTEFDRNPNITVQNPR